MFATVTQRATRAFSMILKKRKEPNVLCPITTPLSPVAAVEQIKGEPWQDFAGRRGDWGRDLALYVARTRSGRTLSELGALSGMNVDGVSKAIQRMRSRLSGDKKLNRVHRKVMLALKEKG